MKSSSMARTAAGKTIRSFAGKCQEKPENKLGTARLVGLEITIAGILVFGWLIG